MVLTIALIIQGAIFGAFCSFVAKNKNRNIATWYVLGFFFSFIALIALAAVPKIEPIENIKALQRKSLWMISSFIGLIALFIYLVFAWHNLSLPDSVYKYFPSPNYKLKVTVHDFETSMQQMESKFEQLNETEKYSIVKQELELVEYTIDRINSINGLEEEVRIPQVASLLQIKLRLVELKNLFEESQKYQYRY